MAKADRLERLDDRRMEREAAYAGALTAALRRTAAGSWGLFGHRKDRQADAKFAPVIAELNELGEAIDGMRGQLGIGPFALHRDFLASRGPVASSAAGEPKQALAWLERLGAAATDNR
jgi:hypothetical protein